MQEENTPAQQNATEFDAEIVKSETADIQNARHYLLDSTVFRCIILLLFAFELFGLQGLMTFTLWKKISMDSYASAILIGSFTLTIATLSKFLFGDTGDASLILNRFFNKK